MPRYDELKTVRKLSDRGDTNSVVHLVKEANADNLYVRKVIFGIEQPLYQGIFLREVQALYKLNNCDNIVKIIAIEIWYIQMPPQKLKRELVAFFWSILVVKPWQRLIFPD